MDLDRLGPQAPKLVQDVAGYLNFSSGTPDVRFLQAINALFGQIASVTPSTNQPVWRTLREVLQRGLQHLQQHSEAFRHADQAFRVLELVFDEVLPAYLRFHRDLLFHQTDDRLFQPFFLGRACEAVLASGGPWEETERILSAAIRRLNDFLGYRPVAVLRTAQKMQPYEHEWVGAIPLYIRGAGVAWGRYHDLLDKALEILAQTDPDLMNQAWFHLDHLDEVALDPRAYDFDHPVNRRPNYHFGTWDLHRIDNRGYYRRFVLQEVTLEGLLSRVAESHDLPKDELLFEAAAVLACTMLMGSGVTGDGPEALDSSMTLAKLVVRIAAYRDAFYERLLRRLGGRHAKRLRAEAQVLRQPFGGVRQHLNQALARRRAQQMQHVQLAKLFARMGAAEAALQQARIVPVASARMRCEIDCRLSAAASALDHGRLEEAATLAAEIEDWVHRAIECGAMVDPWNILGFGGQFSRFPAVEDSVPDERVEELTDLLNRIFALYARLRSRAAAVGDQTLSKRLSDRMKALARWWDQFATTEVSGVSGFSGQDAWESAGQVAEALGAWHREGAAAGSIAFWRPHVERFQSPKAYALLIEALLDHRDLVATMAVLVHWLSQAEQIGLAEGEHSFHTLAARWMEHLWANPPPAPTPPSSTPSTDPRWSLTRKLFDFFEANAESYWQVPRLEWSGAERSPDQPASMAEAGPENFEPEPDDSAEDLFRAAYENMVYRDSADDGFEGDMLEGAGPTTDFELAYESERISQRLAFLMTVCRLWKKAVVASAGVKELGPDRDEVLFGWTKQAQTWRHQLDELLDAVHGYPLPAPRGTHESLIEFDRRRAIKDALLERIIAVWVETADTARFLPTLTDREPPAKSPKTWEILARRMLWALYNRQIEFAKAVWPPLRRALLDQPLLYRPVGRGGSPHRVAHARSMHQVLRRLLVALPRAGLVQQAGELLDTIQRMERDHPVGPAAITEFDRLFEIAEQAILECVIASADSPPAPAGGETSPRRISDRGLIDLLERPIEVLLKRWLDHSRQVRVSLLEAVAEEDRWKPLRRFIERYGHDLFTQRFLAYGNIRAILHQGVDRYLRSLEEEAGDEPAPRLIHDLNIGVARGDACRWLELCLEAVAEHYTEYLDYNSTTTQSDRGEMLYVLLDFLRLEASYERVAWNLRPVLLAHRVLIQAGRSEAARRWRNAVAERTAELADEHLKRLDRLAAQYGVRLRSVADRLAQRFVQPLAVDWLCALVRPALEELRAGPPGPSFALLEKELQPFTAEPAGVGFDLPEWLDALEREVQRAQSQADEEDTPTAIGPPVPQVALTIEQLRGQIDAWERG